MMSGIRDRNTRPEIQVRQYLHAHGFRYRLGGAGLPGRPDLVLRKWNAAIFVHGCFWHGHKACKYFRLPATRREFWKAKIEANAVRDQVRIHQLRELGWRVAVVWECGLREAPKETLADLEKYLVSGNSFVELRGIKKQLCKRLRRPDALTKVELHCQPV